MRASNPRCFCGFPQRTGTHIAPAPSPGCHMRAWEACRVRRRAVGAPWLAMLAALAFACSEDGGDASGDGAGTPDDGSADAPGPANPDSTARGPEAGSEGGDTLSGDGDADATAVPDAGSPVYGTCDLATRLGGFTVGLDEGAPDPADHFTTVGGEVRDGVVPADVPNVTMEEAGCRLLRPPELFCDPACESGDTCGAEGSCVAFPVGMSVGDVTLGGLSAPVEITARPPSYRYFFAGDLPHPGFGPGDTVTLGAAGGDGEPFAIAVEGVAPLEVPGPSVALATDQPVVVRWTAADGSDAVGVEVELNIANHGGTPARILCEGDDSGELELPLALTNALLELGYSGFPSLRLTGKAELAAGCIDFRVQSEFVFEVEIPGLTSCSTDQDCESPETCQLDLTCG